MGFFSRWTDPVVRANALMAKAHAYLDAYQPDKALKVAAKLAQMGATGAHEIQARAYEMQDEPDQAIFAAEKGVAATPGLGRLWLILGNLYSDADRLDDAEGAFTSAAACGNADLATLHYHQAVLFKRQHRHPEAMAAVTAVHTDDLGLQLAAVALQASLLGDAGQWEEAIVLAAAHEDADPEWDHGQAMGGIYGAWARALWHGRQDRDAAVTRAVAAVERHRLDKTALHLLRDMAAVRVPDAVWGELTVEGVWSGPIGDNKKAPGFHREFEVVARDANEAMTLASLFFAAEIHPSLRCHAWVPGDPAPDALLGVYRTSGHAFFRR